MIFNRFICVHFCRNRQQQSNNMADEFKQFMDQMKTFFKSQIHQQQLQNVQQSPTQQPQQQQQQPQPVQQYTTHIQPTTLPPPQSAHIVPHPMQQQYYQYQQPSSTLLPTIQSQFLKHGRRSYGSRKRHFSDIDNGDDDVHDDDSGDEKFITRRPHKRLATGRRDAIEKTESRLANIELALDKSIKSSSLTSAPTATTTLAPTSSSVTQATSAQHEESAVSLLKDLKSDIAAALRQTAPIQSSKYIQPLQPADVSTSSSAVNNDIVTALNTLADKINKDNERTDATYGKLLKQIASIAEARQQQAVHPLSGHNPKEDLPSTDIATDNKKHHQDSQQQQQQQQQRTSSGSGEKSQEKQQEGQQSYSKKSSSIAQKRKATSSDVQRARQALKEHSFLDDACKV